MWTTRKIISAIINILAIILMFVLGYKYMIGVVVGMIISIMILLFPSEIGLIILDRVFGYSKSQGIVMKDEVEKTNRTRKVKFKRS